jgi:hypothetical protein
MALHDGLGSEESDVLFLAPFREKPGISHLGTEREMKPGVGGQAVPPPGETPQGADSDAHPDQRPAEVRAAFHHSPHWGTRREPCGSCGTTS